MESENNLMNFFVVFLNKIENSFFLLTVGTYKNKNEHINCGILLNKTQEE